MQKKISLIGSGGHALVVLDAIRLAHPTLTLEVTDDDNQLSGTFFDEYPIITPAIHPDISNAHICIGNNAIRQKLAMQLLAQQRHLFTVIHPKATVSSLANLEAGTFVACNAVIAPKVHIGKCCIINHGAIVDHECVIGDWCHIAPNATIGGNCRIGDSCLIGANATILPGITIGKGSIVGAGAVVISNVPSGSVMVGVPARSR